MDYAAYISKLVAQGRAAQKIAEGFSQEKVDELCGAIAYATTRPEFLKLAADALYEESEMGKAEHKAAKINTKIRGAYYQMKGRKSVGLVDFNPETGVSAYAKPMGVIGAIIPVTNGEATPILKVMMALKTRNAIILAPHPKAAKTNVMIVDFIKSILEKYGVPVDLVQAVAPDYVSIEASGELMKQSDFVLATGGTPMVRQAYSSGTPTIGVGTGNVVTIVDGTTNMDDTADLIVRSKTFDEATSCSTENNIIVFEDCYDAFVEAMARKGAVLLKDGTPEREALIKALWPETPANHNLNRYIVAKPVGVIADAAGLKLPEGTVMLMAEENGGYGNDFPLTGEKLSVVSGVRKCKTFEEALEQMMKMLEYQGKGHSCGIHTTMPERIHTLGELVPVSRIVVNQPQCLANSGAWTNGLPMTLTLGCGTWGFNSVSHNVTWKDLLNYTYVSTTIPSYEPKDEELFDESVRNFFK